MATRLPKIGGTSTTEDYQREMLAALAREGIDTTPARDLTNQELQAWIDDAEDKLMEKVLRMWCLRD